MEWRSRLWRRQICDGSNYRYRRADWLGNERAAPDEDDGVLAQACGGATASRRSSGLRSAGGLLADLAGGPHGVEYLGDDFSRASAAAVIVRLGLEQLRAGQYHPQLVVQAVEENPQIRAELPGRVGAFVASRGYVHACDPVVVLTAAETCRAGDAGSRQSESAKIRIAPPAVRTYSTFPADIQL